MFAYTARSTDLRALDSRARVRPHDIWMGATEDFISMLSHISWVGRPLIPLVWGALCQKAYHGIMVPGESFPAKAQGQGCTQNAHKVTGP